MATHPKKAVVPKGSDGLYHCPDTLKDGSPCPATFEYPTGLGIHRKMAHGVVGSSHAAIAYRKAKVVDAKAAKKAAKLAKLEPLTKLSPAIPVKPPRGRPPKDRTLAPTQPSMFEEVGVEVPVSMDTPGAFPCPGCSRVFTTIRGRTKHTSHEHPELLGQVKSHKTRPSTSISTLAVSKGHLNGKNGYENTLDGSGETLTRYVPNELVTFVIGQFKALCQGVAYENDIPTRDFTRRCALHFHALAGRQ